MKRLPCSRPSLFPQQASPARRALIAALLAGAALPGAAIAQSGWTPAKPVRVIVPFAPGGGGDTAARLVSSAIGDRLGQPMVVENKAGASGVIASEYVYNAAPDGQVLLLGTADTQAMNPHVNRVRFDSLKYVPVAGIAKVSFVLVGRPGLPAEDLKALLALTKGTSLTYGTSGNGAASHVQTNMFADVAGIGNLLHVPFQGAGPAFHALVGGQVDLMMAPISLAGQYRDKLRFYGVASVDRNDALPGVPTLGEQGYPVDGDSWVCLLAPPGTPAPIRDFVAAKVGEAIATPELQQRLRDVGMTPFKGTSEEFARFYVAEYAKWGEAVRKAGVKQD